MAHRAVDIASDKQALDILLLDIKGICSFADYFVICSGESDRQLKAILESIEETLRKEARLKLRHEGDVDTGWVLLDGGDVVIHIFSPEQRHFYQLEELWGKATPVLRIQ